MADKWNHTYEFSAVPIIFWLLKFYQHDNCVSKVQYNQKNVKARDGKKSKAGRGMERVTEIEWKERGKDKVEHSKKTAVAVWGLFGVSVSLSTSQQESVLQKWFLLKVKGRFHLTFLVWSSCACGLNFLESLLWEKCDLQKHYLAWINCNSVSGMSRGIAETL